METKPASSARAETAERLSLLGTGAAVALPTLAYWAAIAYAAWSLAGWGAAAAAVAFIAAAMTLALSVARAAGRCSRMEEGRADER